MLSIGVAFYGTHAWASGGGVHRCGLDRLLMTWLVPQQGVDCVNACLGATTAVFNAVNWMESRAWDGRLAVVVASDVSC